MRGLAPIESYPGIQLGHVVTLLNVTVREDVGWMCMDTMTLGEKDRDLFQQSKMLPLVHVNAVFGCRGDLQFLWFLFPTCCLMRVTDFDELLNAWPECLAQATLGYFQQSGRTGFDVIGSEQNVALLGWSNSRERPVCLTAVRTPGRNSFDVAEAIVPFVAPDPGHAVPCVPTLLAMESLAREQVSKVRHDFPGAPIGGRLLLAEVTRKGTSIRELATLG